MGIRPIILFHIMLFAGPCFAQTLSRHSVCLDAAYDVQIKYYKAQKKYLAKVDELKKLLPETCRTYRYEVALTKPEGFKVTMEWHEEIWTVNQKNDFERLSAIRPVAETPTKPAPAGAAPSPVVPHPEANFKANEPQMKAKVITEPLSVLPVVRPRQPSSVDAKKSQPLAMLANLMTPPREPDLFIGVQAFETAMSPSAKLEYCYNKSKFRTKDCVETFAEMDSRCKSESKPSDLCIEYGKAVESTNLDICEGADKDYGKCELRRKRLEKKCDNPLAQLSGDCRMLKVYLTSFVPSIIDMPVTAIEGPIHRAPALSCEKGDRQLCVADYCNRASFAGATREDLARCSEAQGLQSGRASTRYLEEVTTIESGLKVLSRLRPVHYQWKESHLSDLGFVAEEVQIIDPMLVTYSEQGQIQGVKYNQISALLTAGIQELYGRCEATSTKQEDIARRIDLVESINTQLMHENIVLKKRLDQQAKDLEQIKSKMGLN
jgi:hypothetical protein